MSKIIEYQLSNFKPFSGPVTIPIRPITLIFGPNSSGKSAILQSILMLKQTLIEGNRKTRLLPKGNLVDLGNYKEFVHCHDINRSFSFKVTMNMPKLSDVVGDMASVRDSVYGDFMSDFVFQLEKSVNFDTIGLSISFLCDKESLNINVGKIELFLGNDPKPIIVYNYNNENNSNYVNIKHKYWLSYCNAFLDKKFEDIIAEESIEVKGIMKELHISIISDISDKNEGDRLDLFKYLPVNLNHQEMWYIVNDVFGEPSEDAKSLSIFTLVVSDLFRGFLDTIIYIGPLRDYPERYYIDSGNITQNVGKFGKMTPYILFNNDDLVKRLNERIEKFHLGYNIIVSRLSDEESEINDVFVLRLIDKETGVKANITDVGFGVSQVLPIIVQSELEKNGTLLIEQPELHLHPALQAELGDIFIESALGKNQNTFIIETHSEHLILRLLRRIRETSEGELEQDYLALKPEDISVIYAKPSKKGSELIQLRVTEDGDFEDNWPDGFFTERAKELF